jgi:hypothetical protein
MRHPSITFLALLASLVLTACGGGGGDDTPAGASASTASTPAHDETTDTPAPAAPAPIPAPTPRTVSLISNDLPQAGSSTAIGNGVEGFWVAPAGVASGFGFVTPGGGYLAFVAAPSTHPALFHGSLVLAGTGWTFAPASRWSISDGTNAYAASLSGTGGVMLRHRFQGRYRTGQSGTDQPLAYDYAQANALAVSQADVAGDWRIDDITLSVDPDGVLTGGTRGERYGRCALRGSLTHNDLGTRKNLFDLSFSAMPTDDPADPPCLLDAAQRFQGHAAVTLSGGDNSGMVSLLAHRHSLSLLARDGAHRLVAAEFDRDLSRLLIR